MGILKTFEHRLKFHLLRVKDRVFGEGKTDRIKRYSILSRYTGIKSGRPADDFDWDLYPIHYRGELEKIARECTLQINHGDYSFSGRQLVKKNDVIAPLHPNHRLLYETLLQLNPDSVFEMGCGGGDHLRNIHALNPAIGLHAIDRSQEQLDLLSERNDHLDLNVWQCDATLPFPGHFPRVDLAFTQAVLMHIRAGNGYRVALSNLFSVARKYVMLMENWTRHEFLSDIRELVSRKAIAWDEVHFYFNHGQPDSQPKIMIISAQPLSTFDPLTDQDQLL